MRILFVTEINRTLISSGYLSLATMYLSAILKRDGHQCDVSPVNYKEAKRTFTEFCSDIVAYSAFTGLHVPMVELNRKLKKKFNFFSMFGGHHPTFFPELIEEDGIDAVCQKEGFKAVPALINSIEKFKDITTIPNWWIKKDGKIYKNKIAPQIKSLDSLPFPDRSIFDKYSAYRNSKSFSFMAGFGCPYKCTYCFNHVANKMLRTGDRIIRRRSVDNVIREINEVKKKYPLKFVLFRDEIFTLNKNWIEEFSRKYPAEVGLPFNCVVRANHITEKIMDDLKSAGVFSISFGIESGNDFLRNNILKRNMNKETILRAAKIMHDKEVPFFTFNLLGIPGETFDMALETWELNVKCRPSGSWPYLFYPYPLTELHDYALENNYLDKEKKIDYLSTYHDKSILNLKDKREIENFHKLFPIAVEFPFLIYVIKYMVKLPLRDLYNIIRKVWRAYIANSRYYPKTAKQSLKEGAAIILDVVFRSKA